MAKKGMARPERTDMQAKNELPPVPELQGKAKHKKQRARPIIAGTSGMDMKVYHANPHKERGISNSHDVYDNDLASENLESDYDTTFADMHDV